MQMTNWKRALAMGCWSETILGGDVPLDILFEIEKTLNKYAGSTLKRFDGLYPLERLVDDLVDDEAACQDLRSVFEKHVEEVTDAVNLYCESEIDEGLLVVGSVAMALGAHVDNSLRTRILDAAQRDDWSKDNENRQRNISNFISAMEKHKPGHHWCEHTEFLIDKVIEHVNSGSPGLVNKRC